VLLQAYRSSASPNYEACAEDGETSSKLRTLGDAAPFGVGRNML